MEVKTEVERVEYRKKEKEKEMKGGELESD